MDMNHNGNKICYTTLALGYEYNSHALKLCEDAHRLSPGTPVVVLTDRPRLFINNPNVITVKHRIQSVGIFHDKLCCIEASLKRFQCCIFLDADCRLMSDMANSRQWKPGLTAKVLWGLGTHIQPKKVSESAIKRQALAHEVADSLGLLIDDCRFIHEAAFIVCSDNGKEDQFIKSWAQIRDFLEFNGMYSGEGMAMGLAACHASLKVYHYNRGYDCPDIKDVFKDDFFYKLIFHNDSDGLPDELCRELLRLDRDRQQRQRLPIWQKVIRKVWSPTLQKIRLARLRMINRGKIRFVDFG